MDSWPTSKPRQCFLIDDDADDREVFGLALKALNLDISSVEAADGVEALRKLTTDTSFIPQVIFLDVNMPQMNGIECLKQIRSLSHLREVDVFIYSTNTDPLVREATLTLGAHLILKPTGFDELVATLRDILKQQA